MGNINHQYDKIWCEEQAMRGSVSGRTIFFNALSYYLQEVDPRYGIQKSVLLFSFIYPCQSRGTLLILLLVQVMESWDVIIWNELDLPPFI